MNIAYLCQYFVPEPGAPSARLHDLGKAWVEMGQSVTVVTGFPNHPTGVLRDADRGRWWAEERLSGMRVLRNRVYATPNEGVVRKTLGHLSFMASSFIFGLPRLSGTDVVIASSPSFFGAVSGWLIAACRRVPFVFEVRDLWPAVFVDLGILRNRTVIAILERLELFLYRRARLVVTVTESFRRDLIARGVPDSKVVTITNGADVEFFTPGPRDNAVRAEMGIGDRFLVLYIGAHGISHALQTALLAAERLSGRDDIRFALVGEGAEKQKLMSFARAKGLQNVVFLPAQPKDWMPAYYQAADACLVPLRDVPLFAGFIPSKMFEIMACGRPVVGSVAGEARDILERSGSALLVTPESDEELAGAILTLVADPARGRQLGEAGRRFVVAHYSRPALARRYLTALDAITGSRR